MAVEAGRLNEHLTDSAIIERRRRGRIIWRAVLSVAILFLVAFGVVMYISQPVNVRISEFQAQEMLDSQIGTPVSGRLGVTVTAKELHIDFRNDDRLALDAELILRGFGQEGRASGTIRSGIRYDSPYIYLRDMNTADLRVDLDTNTDRRLSDLATVIGDRLRREREAIKDEAAGEAFDRLVRDGAVALAGMVPIYDLRDAGIKGSVAALALDGVRFEEEAVILTLSSRAALLRILTFLGLIALLVTYVVAQILPGYVFDRISKSTK